MDRCCPCCKTIKPLSEFGNSRNRKNGKGCYCRPCASQKQRQRWAANREHNIQKSRERYAKNPSKQCFWARKHKYGLTEGDIRLLLDSQNGVCAICGTPISLSSCNIDHDHVNNNLRGILCGKCNRGLGHFNDSPEVLRKAATYLKRTMQ